MRYGVESISLCVRVAVVAILTAWNAQAAKAPERLPTRAEISRMEEAAPAKAPVKPATARKVLVWGHVWTHLPNPFASEALKVLARKSGAFEVVISDDPALLLPERLEEFDCLLMNNIHERDPFLPQHLAAFPKKRQETLRRRDKLIKLSIIDFVAGGTGLVGIHAATAAFQGWPEYGEMIGGYYSSHITRTVPIRLEDPRHPTNACFGGKGFRFHDEIYIFKHPYSRKKVRVLLGLDMRSMNDPGKRVDKDYAVTWVRSYGKGRVFYCSLGHAPATYWNPLFLRHILAGIQFAIGDLLGETAPLPAR